MRKQYALAGVLMAAWTWSAAAKPPESPQPNKVNGEVPSPTIQEFFQEPAEPKPQGAPSVAPRRPLPVVAGNSVPARCPRQGAGKRAAAPAGVPGTPLENLDRLVKAERYFRLGEALREAGDWKLAVRAYEDAQRAAPGSRYAEQAAQRTQRLSAYAGVEEAQADTSAATETSFRVEYGPIRLRVAKWSISVEMIVRPGDDCRDPAPK